MLSHTSKHDLTLLYHYAISNETVKRKQNGWSTTSFEVQIENEF